MSRTTQYDLARHFLRSANKHAKRAKTCTTRPQLKAVLDRMTDCYEEAERLDPSDPSDLLNPWADTHGID